MHAHHCLGEANTDTLLYKLWQKLHDTPERAAQPDSRTRTATQLVQSPLLKNSVTLSGPCQMWPLRSRDKSLSTGRIRFTQTSTPNGLAIRQGLPNALCAEDQTVRAPHMLLRCNNHTLKRMHINRHPHAVSICGEEISKGKLGLAIVTMDACNSEKLSDLIIEPPDDIERIIPDWVFPTQQNLSTRHQSRPDGVLVMPIEGSGRHLNPKQIPTRDRDTHLVQFKFCSDINPQQTLEKAHNQAASTPYPASTNMEPPRHLALETTKSHFMLYCYTSWSQGHNLQSIHHISSTELVPTHKVHQPATKLH